MLTGVALGDLLVGLPIDANEEFTGNFFDLLTPYGLLLGVTMLVLCLLHGSTFLGLKTEGAVRERSQGLAVKLAWPAALLVAVYGVWTTSISDAPLWATLFLVVPFVAAVAAAFLVRAGHEGGSFTATAVTIGGVIAGLFANLYPYVMVSSTDAANNLTVQSTASNHYALQVMTVVALLLFPVVLIYQGWTYWVFRARVKAPTDAAGAARLTRSRSRADGHPVGTRRPRGVRRATAEDPAQPDEPQQRRHQVGCDQDQCLGGASGRRVDGMQNGQ